jgi:hypothetical protein
MLSILLQTKADIYNGLDRGKDETGEDELK